MGQVRRLILDSNALIEYERRRFDRAQFAADDLAAGAISIAEFREGVERADNADRRERRLAVLVELQDNIGVLDYTEATAIGHAKLLAYTRRSGRQRGRHDLIIAAHAVETGRTIVSRDAAARFGDLPGVTAIEPLR